VKVGPVRVVVGAHVFRWDLVRRGHTLAGLLQHRVAEDLAELLLRDGVLVVAAGARLVGEEHDVDHLAEQLLRRSATGSGMRFELIEVLERGPRSRPA